MRPSGRKGANWRRHFGGGRRGWPFARAACLGARCVSPANLATSGRRPRFAKVRSRHARTRGVPVQLKAASTHASKRSSRAEGAADRPDPAGCGATSRVTLDQDIRRRDSSSQPGWGDCGARMPERTIVLDELPGQDRSARVWSEREGHLWREDRCAWAKRTDRAASGGARSMSARSRAVGSNKTRTPRWQFTPSTDVRMNARKQSLRLLQSRSSLARRDWILRTCILLGEVEAILFRGHVKNTHKRAPHHFFRRETALQRDRLESQTRT